MRFKILIVDDEEDIRDILISIVEMIFIKDYPFLTLSLSSAQNGQEALGIVKKEHQDMIISDMVMPIMDGFAFIKKVRSFDLSVPILVLSALSSSEQIDEIMKIGANNYTSKPLNGKLFTAQVKLFVDFYLRRNKRYNYKTINLFSKNIYKRKTEFLIDREDDLSEFWEFILCGVFDKYKFDNILHFIYDIELLMIKNGISNTIILEEDNGNFYFTLFEMDKIDDELVLSKFIKHNILEANYEKNDFFISLVLAKKESDSKSIIKDEDKNIKKVDKSELKNDIRYSMHENVTPEEFLSELDPSYEDKIENFFDDLNLLSVEIANLRESSFEDRKNAIKEIIFYLTNFNIIISYIGLFSVINRSFNSLIDFLDNLDDEILENEEKAVLLTGMLQYLSNDLESWIRLLFIEKKAVDIHYFDASFAENCFTIETTFSESEEDTEEDDEDMLEFF